ncbi:MAG: LPS assembly lipoprotein LptE [Rhizobiaceae bacterium]
MWSSDVRQIQRLAGTVSLLFFIASCTVQPLNSTTTNQLSLDGTSSSVRGVMKTISVKPVKTRVAQQVRNNLLFDLNGGQQEPGGQYVVSLQISSASQSLAVEGDSLSSTSTQVAVTAVYTLLDTSTGKPVSTGKRRAVASFDQTPQKFANERAQRDAENRAAKVVAQQLRLAIGQALTQANS